MHTAKHNISNASGFTLVEIMISVTIAAIGTAAVFSAFLAQHRSYSSQSRSSEATDQGRLAMDVIESSLLTAGYGIHPPVVFDFSQACGGGSTGNCTAAAGVASACNAQPCLDRTNAPDELVFYSRSPNPSFSWYVKDVSSTTIVPFISTITDNSDPLYNHQSAGIREKVFRMGSIFLSICEGAATSAYVQTQDNVTGTGTDQSLTIVGYNSTNPFRQNVMFNIATNPCFFDVSTRAFLVNKYRYYIRDLSGIPYLMLDNGLDMNGDNILNTNDHLPIAAGIEDMQVAYIMNNGQILGATGNAEPVRFANNTTDLTTLGDAPYLASGAATTHNGIAWPSYDQASAHASRTTNAAANIRNVRVSISARSADVDPALANNPRDNKPTLENHNPSGSDSFRRTMHTTTIAIRNLVSRAQFDMP